MQYICYTYMVKTKIFETLICLMDWIQNKIKILLVLDDSVFILF